MSSINEIKIKVEKWKIIDQILQERVNKIVNNPSTTKERQIRILLLYKTYLEESIKLRTYFGYLGNPQELLNKILEE